MMNKTLLLTGASAFALMLGVSAPSYADGANATAEGTSSDNTAIDDGSVRENISLDNWNGGATGIVHSQQNNGNNNAINAATSVHADVNGGGAVDSAATAKSTSDNNETDHYGDHPKDRKNLIGHTMEDGFVGSATFQQNNGDNNSINSATAIDGIDGDLDSFDQTSNAISEVTDNDGEEDASTNYSSVRSNKLQTHSLDGSAGIFTVQQNNGGGNAMSSATSAGGVTGSAGDVDQKATAWGTSQDNDADSSRGELPQDATYNSFNYVNNAANDFTGVLTVQQNNGESNAMSSATAVLGVGEDADSVTQRASANHGLNFAAGNQTGDDGSIRENKIGRSLADSAGVITVQQNNGSGNTINSGTAVVAVLGEADSLTQSSSANSRIAGTGDNQTSDISNYRDNTISEGSFNHTLGVITVQQNNGDANAMSAATAVAYVGEDAGDVSQDALAGQVVPTQQFGPLYPGANRNTIDSEYSTRSNLIEDMHNVDGVITVQQNNGDANNMSAANAVAVVGSADTLTQSAATANSAKSNDTDDIESSRSNDITLALHGVDGVLSVQQNNGNANSMAVANAVAASLGDTGEVSQTVSAEGFAAQVNADDDASVRSNKITNSFHGLDGIATVQQNNGDSNTMNVSNGVALVMGEAGSATQDVSANGAANGTDFINMDHGTGRGKFGPMPHRDNDIDPSFNNVTGIVTLQQNNGNGNSMNVANAALVTLNGGEDTDQTVSAGGNSEGNNTIDFHSTRRNTLDDASFDNFEGMATIQQNNGDSNVMSAANGVVANLSDDRKLNDVDQDVSTDTRTSGNNSLDLNLSLHKGPQRLGNRVNRINQDVFNGAQGIVTVQQNNGNGNAMATATGVRADIGSTQTTSRPNYEEVLTQNVSTTGIVDSNNHSIEVSLPNGNPDPRQVERANLLGYSFQDGANGVFTIQQNNGDGNAIGASTGVAANIDTKGDIDSTIDNNATTTGTVKGEGRFDGALDLWANRHNTIRDGAFDGAAGIITIQQNNGNNNVMGAATGVVANVNTVKSVGEGGAEANSMGTATIEGNGSISTMFTDRRNDADAIMAGTQGIMTIQQNNGDNNVMGAATDVVATTEEPGFGPAASNATLSATVSDNFALNTGTIGAPGYSNSLTGSFAGASGVMTVQQNNGNNSAMQSAVSVIANGISFDFN